MRTIKFIMLTSFLFGCSDIVAPVEAEEHSTSQRILQLEEHVGDLLKVVNVLASRTTVSEVTHDLIQALDEAVLPSSVETIASCPVPLSKQIEESCLCGGDLPETLMTQTSHKDNATGDLTCGCSPVHVTSTGTISVIATIRCLGVIMAGPEEFVENGDLPLGFEFEVSSEAE